MKVIHGLNNGKGTLIEKQPAAGVGQMRCPKCTCLATQQRMADGKVVMRCQGCGANLTGQGMDKAFTAPAGTVPRRPTAGNAR